jgi:apolipoprotein N-acyltransferase
MKSVPNTIAWRVLLIVVFTLLSGAGFYFGTGLHPLWWLIWLAALPVLLIAPKVTWRLSSAIALTANIIGGMNMWAYYRMLKFPLFLSVEAVLIPALVFTIAVSLFRSFFCRGQPWLAALVFPSFISTCDYLISLRFGTYGNIGYTQMDNLPVLQLGSFTGMWGISFVVMLFAPMAALTISSRNGTRFRMASVLAAILICTFGYGAWRLRVTPPAPHSVMVGLADSDVHQNIFPSSDQQKMELMREYSEQTRSLAARGAKIVVLPEMIVRASGELSGQIDDLFKQTAQSTGAQVLLGVLHETSAGTFNEARLYSESGTVETVYRKHHLVPAMEAGTTPGNDVSVLHQPVGTVGVAICRDMDYLQPARIYGWEGTGLLLVPAWDFDVDRWSHGRMALMRGVEQGFSIVRSVKLGLLTVSDNRGRVLGEARTTPDKPFTTLLARVPIRHDSTLYQRAGDWFAWLNLAGLVSFLALWLAGWKASRLSHNRKQLRDPSNQPAEPEEASQST